MQTTCRGNGCDRREQTETAHNQGSNGCASGRQSNGCNTNVNRNRQTGNNTLILLCKLNISETIHISHAKALGTLNSVE